MRRSAAAVAALACALLVSKTWAQQAEPVPKCPNEKPPAGAGPVVPMVDRLFRQLTDAAEVKTELGQATSIETYCVTPYAVFVSPEWLLHVIMDGPSGRTGTLLALAWVLALQSQGYRQPASTPTGGEGDAAWFTGCTARRLGLADGATLDRNVNALRTLVAPSNAVAWYAGIRKGYRSCAGR